MEKLYHMPEAVLIKEKQLAVREQKESQRIMSRFLELARGDVDEAQRLRRGVLYVINGSVIDASLFYAEDVEEMASEAEIYEAAETLAEQGLESLAEDLLASAMQKIQTDPSETAFSIGLLADLLGKEALIRLSGMMKDDGYPQEIIGELLKEETFTEIRSWYDRAVERLMVEWENDLLLDYLKAAYLSWGGYSTRYEEAIASKADQETIDFLGAGLVNSRIGVRMMLRIAIDRQLVRPGRDLVVSALENEQPLVISYDEALEILG